MSEVARATLKHRPVTRLAHERIRTMARNLGSDQRLPTVAELRDSLGVSLRTLNDALQVLEEQNVIYRKNGVGIFVAPPKRPSICLVCPSHLMHGGDESTFWNVMLTKAVERAERTGNMLTIHPSQPAAGVDSPFHKGFLDDIRDGEVGGILGVAIQRASSNWIGEQGIPYVAYASPAEYTVNTPPQPLIDLAVAKLAECGCRRIGLWMPALSAWHLQAEAAERFRRRLEEVGLPCDESLAWPCDAAGGGHVEVASQSLKRQGYDVAMKFFAGDRQAWPDGLIITDNVMTSGVLGALQNLDVAVGRDLVIASHCNKESDVLLGHAERLIRLQIDPAEIASKMLDMLEVLMDGGTPPMKAQVVEPIALMMTAPA